MPSLLDLPNEIVILIANVVHAAEIESFSSCNKRIHWLSEEALKKHKRMKAQYGELDFGGCAPWLWTSRRQGRRPNPIFFLRNILNDDNLAHYPTKLFISEVTGQVEDWSLWSLEWQEEMQEKIMEALADCRDSITTKVEGCPYIEPEERQCWIQEIFGGSEATLLALLILYLPNLRSITFANTCWAELERLEQLTAKIAVATRESKPNPCPLDKLSHLGLERVCNLFEDRPGTPIMGLPSLRRLSGDSVTGHDLKWSEPYPSTDIADISLIRSHIDVHSFKSILSNVKGLQTFKYSFAIYSSYWILDWDPRSIVQILQTYATHSLKSLDLTIYSVYLGNNMGATFVDCLPDFQALKRVRLQHNMFVEMIPTPTSRTNRPIALDKEAEASPLEVAEKRIHRLVDLLPASIEIVDLICPLRGKTEALAMMEGLPELKESRLPRLSALRMEVDEKLDVGMKASFKDAGIDLVWWMARNTPARNGHEWKGKQFEERVKRDTLMDTLGAGGLDTMLAVLGVE